MDKKKIKKSIEYKYYYRYALVLSIFLTLFIIASASNVALGKSVIVPTSK